MYELDEFTTKKNLSKMLKSRSFFGLTIFIGIVALLALLLLKAGMDYSPSQTRQFLQSLLFPQNSVEQNQNITALNPESYESRLSYEQAIIDAARNVSPSVVSIVISKNVPIYEEQYIDPFGGEFDPFGLFNFQIPQYVQKGSEFKEVGAGSGFIVSADGLIVTNKHVVSDKKAEYAVFTSEGKKYTAKVVAIDPLQDLAIIKIDTKDGETFLPARLGSSAGIQIGQTVVAIGNALGQFSNTVSVGVVSGLQRTISASDGAGFSEKLEGIIQTDAAINSGNSGGPLVNLKGEVIGINTAMAEDAQSIGFALPIDIAKRDITQVQKNNKIVYPFLGVRYTLVDDAVQKEYNLSVDYGALVLAGENGEPAVTKDSGAQKAGIQEKDVILNVNGEKITTNNSMAKIIQKYNPGDTVTLNILREDKEQSIVVLLGERPE